MATEVPWGPVPPLGAGDSQSRGLHAASTLRSPPWKPGHVRPGWGGVGGGLFQNLSFRKVQ